MVGARGGLGLMWKDPQGTRGGGGRGRTSGFPSRKVDKVERDVWFSICDDEVLTATVAALFLKTSLCVRKVRGCVAAVLLLLRGLIG